VGLVGAFVTNPVKVSVGVLLVALFGAIALMRMPMQLTPEVQTPTITVETVWPGASPQEVEREIVQEQEEQLKGVEGVRKMSSECMDSMGRITLEFAVGTDMSEALLKVNTRLQQVREYPEEADEPVLASASSADQPIAWFILRPRMVPRERLEAFQAEHPELASALEPVLAAHSTGLAMRRPRCDYRAQPHDHAEHAHDLQYVMVLHHCASPDAHGTFRPSASGLSLMKNRLNLTQCAPPGTS